MKQWVNEKVRESENEWMWMNEKWREGKSKEMEKWMNEWDGEWKRMRKWMNEKMSEWKSRWMSNEGNLMSLRESEGMIKRVNAKMRKELIEKENDGESEQMR